MPSGASGRLGVVNGPNDPAALAQFNKRIDVAVAEFNVLRAEITQRTTGQAALTGVGLTALGVIFGFALEDKGDIRLLVAVPLLAFFVSALHAAESSRVARIGDYIRDRLEPTLRTETGSNLPAWEKGVGKRRREPSIWHRALLLDFPATALFCLASVGAQLLIWNRDPDFEQVYVVAWALLWALTVLIGVLPFFTVWRIKRNSEDSEAESKRKAESASAPAASE
jgi:hypothetical protein